MIQGTSGEDDDRVTIKEMMLTDNVDGCWWLYGGSCGGVADTG